MSKVKNPNKKLFMSISLAVVGVILLFLLDKGIIGDAYVRRVLNLGAVYCIVAVSMNLVNGFTGLFSLGQAGFMAIGAFTVGIFTLPLGVRDAIFYIEPMAPFLRNVELPFFVALLLGGLIAALVAIIIGTPVLRLKSDYLAIATLGFSEILRIIFSNTQTITNGSLGLKSIPTINTMFLPFSICAIVVILVMLLIRSSYGRAFKAIREDDIAAEAMGISLVKHKVMSFAIGAFFAAIGGGLFASLLGAVEPKGFYFTFTYNFLLIIVLGGMGSITGTVISSFIVTAGLEWLRIFDEPLELFGFSVPLFRPGLRMVVFSAILMILVLYYRNGLMGQKEFSWKLLSDKIKSIKNFFTKSKEPKGGLNR